MRPLALATLCLLLVACRGGSGGVGDKVLTDFGLRAPSADHVSKSDRVLEKLEAVGESERARLNLANRAGEVHYQRGPLGEALYYKEVKVYENSHPTDARTLSGGGDDGTGFIGYIVYPYRIFQSERKPTRTEAEAAPADIFTGTSGREQYAYKFSRGLQWDGRPGKRVKD